MSTSRLSFPIAPSERIDIVDIVRGFALFGILLVNMLTFSGPYWTFEPWALSAAFWDRAAELVVIGLGQGAFYPILALLFGLGFGLQVDRATARGEQVARTFRFRMMWLLVFGLIHGLLIWEGDILTSYAIAGFFLPSFADSSAEKTLKWGAGILLTTGTILAALMSLASFDPEFSEDLYLEATTQAVTAEINRFGKVGFADLVHSRLEEAISFLAPLFFMAPWSFGVFLIGLWVVKSGKLANWRNERPFVIGVLRFSVPLAIASKGTLTAAVILESTPYLIAMTSILDYLLGAGLGVSYLCLILLFFQRRSMSGHLFRHLQPVGRMALTNYLVQSLVAVSVFYGFGLGLYGQLGFGLICLLSMVLFGVQIVLSRLWLDRFQFGPMEWLWRTLTYRTRIG